MLYRFDGTHGAHPYTGLILDKGALYGTTSEGGQFNKGTVFKLWPQGGAVLYSFDGTHGADPSGLTIDSNGVLYGTTYSGGANGTGTVFKLTPPAAGTLWKETVLYSFLGVVSRTDGRNPWGGLTFDASGVLYGTTSFGGTGGKGMVFKLKPWSGKLLRLMHDDAGSGRPRPALPRAEPPPRETAVRQEFAPFHWPNTRTPPL